MFAFSGRGRRNSCAHSATSTATATRIHRYCRRRRRRLAGVIAVSRGMVRKCFPPQVYGVLIRPRPRVPRPTPGLMLCAVECSTSPSTVYHSISTVHRSISTIHHPPPTATATATAHHPLSTNIHHPPSSVHHPPPPLLHHVPSRVQQRHNPHTPYVTTNASTLDRPARDVTPHDRHIRHGSPVPASSVTKRQYRRK